MTGSFRRPAFVAALNAAAFLISACASTVDKIEHIGQPPALSPIVVPPNIAAGAPVLLPQPAPEGIAPQANSDAR